MRALVVAALLAIPVVAVADPELEGRIPPGQGERVFLPPPPGADLTTSIAHVGAVSPIIYLERCKGGCTMHESGVDDAKTYASSIPDQPGEYTVSEFQNSTGQTGAAADAEWNQLVQCVKEVYSPFAAQITDVKPTAATSYHMNIVAGRASQVPGLGNGVLGISPGVNCAAVDNHITYTFANDHGGSGQNRIWHLCWTVAQETAHTYSLDHAYVFADGTSACNDPMTYRFDCGGQKFFRNDSATCGENQPRPCYCGANQNAHLTLLATFGPGTPITAAPTLTVSQPLPNATVSNGASVVASAFSQRGVKTVELWLNGYKWATAPGAKFGANGQPESSYSLQFPAGVPDGVIDIVVKASDDIGITTQSPTITVTKGAPCQTADSCAAGQQCSAGKCFWDAPTGEIGDVCTYNQFCLSGMCQGAADEQRCTTGCIPGVGDSCPDSFDCLDVSPGKGICWPAGKSEPGCPDCSGGSPGGLVVFAAMGLGLVIRRRKR